jgi:hypothetical protein
VTRPSDSYCEAYESLMQRCKSLADFHPDTKFASIGDIWQAMYKRKALRHPAAELLVGYLSEFIDNHFHRDVPGAIKLAVLFHETYERLAPQYGYETKPETRVFDASSPNGKLMIAVCREIRNALSGPLDRASIIEECAKAAEGYNWVDDEKVQSPDEHQAALARAIRALIPPATLDSKTEDR